MEKVVLTFKSGEQMAMYTEDATHLLKLIHLRMELGGEVFLQEEEGQFPAIIRLSEVVTAGGFDDAEGEAEDPEGDEETCPVCCASSEDCECDTDEGVACGEDEEPLIETSEHQTRASITMTEASKLFNKPYPRYKKTETCLSCGSLLVGEKGECNCE